MINLNNTPNIVTFVAIYTSFPREELIHKFEFLTWIIHQKATVIQLSDSTAWRNIERVIQ